MANNFVGGLPSILVSDTVKRADIDVANLVVDNDIIVNGNVLIENKSSDPKITFEYNGEVPSSVYSIGVDASSGSSGNRNFVLSKDDELGTNNILSVSASTEDVSFIKNVNTGPVITARTDDVKDVQVTLYYSGDDPDNETIYSLGIDASSGVTGGRNLILDHSTTLGSNPFAEINTVSGLLDYKYAGMFRGNLSVETAAEPQLSLRETTNTDNNHKSLIQDTSNSLMQISKASNDAGGSMIQIDPVTVTVPGTVNTSVRLFRTTNTSGTKRFEIYQGNGGGTLDHLLISGSNNSYLLANAGTLSLGTNTNTSSHKLLISENTSSTNANVAVAQLGTGDSSIRMMLGDGSSVSYILGIDNSDSDKFVMSRGSVLGTNTFAEVSQSTGNWTIPTVLNNTNVTNSTSISTGSVILSGGLGVAQDIWTNGLYLPSTGAIPSNLNYYATGTHNTDVLGIWPAAQNIDIVWMRIGNQVTLTFPAFMAAADTAGVITNFSALPPPLRPSATTYIQSIVVDDASQRNTVIILLSTGIFTIYASTAEASFSGVSASGDSGMQSRSSVIYTV